MEGVPPININSVTEKHIYIGQKPTKKILGYPYAFNDTMNKLIVMSNLNDVIEPSK